MSKVTVTGVWGGGNAVTAKVIQNVRSVIFNTDKTLLRVLRQDDFIEDFDISTATTVTCTISGTDFTFTIS